MPVNYRCCPRESAACGPCVARDDLPLRQSPHPVRMEVTRFSVGDPVPVRLR